MSTRTKISAFILLTLLSLIVILQVKSYNYPEPEEIKLRLNYLKRVINQPLDQKSEIIMLGDESQEFMLFSYAFSTYAATNLAVKDSTYKSEAAKLIKESILKVLDPKISGPYGIENRIDELDSIPNYSVLYLGHLNLMLGCYRLISSDSTFNDLNNKISKSLF